MVRKIEIALTEEVANLLESASMDTDIDGFARFLLLQGLSAHYQSYNDDENAKKVEALIDRVAP